MPTIYQLILARMPYFEAGENAKNPLVKTENYTSAKKYFETSLKEGMTGESEQLVRWYLAQISTYFGDLEKAAHHDKFDDLWNGG